jgi:AraC family transcriptional regulator
MSLLDAGAVLSAVAPIISATQPHRSAGIIKAESRWRHHPSWLTGAPTTRIIAARWQVLEERTRDEIAETPDDCHVVGIALRRMNTRLSISGCPTRDQVVMPGSLLIIGPRVDARCVFNGASDALHLFVPNDLIAECARQLPGRRLESLCSGAAQTRDAIVERLARALLAADSVGTQFSPLYVDCLGTAVVGRLFDCLHGASAPDRPRVAELQGWRLKRAIEYLEANLTCTVRLADIAAAAGLSRMHFARLFRAATGLRPHEYLLRRRIERAQEMLIASGMSTVEIALAVGFQSQSHFTSVFKGYVGQPPHSWRQAHYGSTSSHAFSDSLEISRMN